MITHYYYYHEVFCSLKLVDIIPVIIAPLGDWYDVKLLINY